MSMGLYNGKKHIAQLLGCHDLHMADGESVLLKDKYPNFEVGLKCNVMVF